MEQQLRQSCVQLRIYLLSHMRIPAASNVEMYLHQRTNKWTCLYHIRHTHTHTDTHTHNKLLLQPN